MRADPREALLACAAEPDGDIVTAALWLACEDAPGLEPAPWVERVDLIAGELRARFGGAPPAMPVPVIAGVLRDRLRLRGAGGADPRAHYLHSVLERGAGIPIACGAIWIGVGRRAGVDVSGVGLPGHFVVRVGSTLVDAFGGGDVLDADDARRLVGRALGSDPVDLDAEWLRPQPVRDILARMSRNLRGCYATRGVWELALRAADRCVALLPDDPAERRDRGVLRWRMGLAGPALADLRHYLEARPDAPDRDVVERMLTKVRVAAN